MFTPYQCQDNARGVSRMFNATHSRAVGWAMSSYHSRAVMAAGPA